MHGLQRVNNVLLVVVLILLEVTSGHLRGPVVQRLARYVELLVQIVLLEHLVNDEGQGFVVPNEDLRILEYVEIDVIEVLQGCLEKIRSQIE